MSLLTRLVPHIIAREESLSLKLELFITNIHQMKLGCNEVRRGGGLPLLYQRSLQGNL